MPYLFPKASWRVVERHQVRMRLDISDLVDWYIYFDLRDDTLNLILSILKPSSVVIDVGTNIGYLASRCARVANDGFVFGFEPSVHNFAKCLDNLSLNDFENCIVQNIGLDETERQINLETVNPNNKGMNRVSTGPSSGTEKITVKTLDQVLRDNGLKRVDLIKLDVEGYELQVLKGAEITVNEFRPILVIEVDDRLLINFGISSSELFNWLVIHQFEVYGIDKQKIKAAKEMANRHLDILAVPIEKSKSIFG